MIRHIGVLLKSCLYKEGAVAAFTGSLAIYAAITLMATYAAKTESLLIPAVILFGITAIVTVIMPTQMRALQTRKTVSLIPNLNVLLLFAGLAVCIFNSLYILPCFYLMGMHSPVVLLGTAVITLWMHSLILILGLLFAKYMTPSLAFLVALILVPLLLIVGIKQFESIHWWLAVISLPVLWLVFGYYWVRKKSQEPLDDGRNWTLRIRQGYSALTHSSAFVSAQGVFVLGNGDSLRAMAKRSLVYIVLSFLLWVLLSGGVALQPSEKSQSDFATLLYLFFFFQFLFLEVIRTSGKLKPLWLISDGDRRSLFKARAKLLIKFAGVHYGFAFVLIALILTVHGASASPELMGVLLLIIYYFVLHLVCFRFLQQWHYSMLPFVVVAFSIGGRLVETLPGGGFTLSQNYFELLLAFGLPLVFIVVCLLQKSRVDKFDFSQRGTMSNLLESAR